MRRAGRANRESAGDEPQRRRQGAVSSAASSRSAGQARTTRAGSARGICPPQTKILLELSKLHFFYYRPQPHRRHRADPGSRRARTKEADHILRIGLLLLEKL